MRVMPAKTRETAIPDPDVQDERQTPAPEIARDPARDAVSQDLDRTFEVIEDAAAAIDEMLRYNRTMKSAAARGVTHYRAEAEEARREIAELARRIAGMTSEKLAIIDAFEERIDALQQRIVLQERELESMRTLLWPGGRGAG